MSENVYYPAVFFADIVKYYGGSEIYIEEQIQRNIARVKSQKLVELKTSLEDLSTIKNQKELSDESRMGFSVLDDLKKIKENLKEQTKIERIEQIINKVKTMTQIEVEILEEIYLKIQSLSLEKAERTGYSDSSILRCMDRNNNTLNEKKYNDIIKYLIEPEVQNDYSDLGEFLRERICSSNYNGIPEEKLERIKRSLIRPDFSGKHILRIFRMLEQCSVGFSEADSKKVQKQSDYELEGDWGILEKIVNALENIWGEIEVEGIGITQEEKKKITFDVSQDLLKDYKFYRKVINDIESAKGFQALIFYRLYNKIFYYTEKNADNMGDDDMQRALAFFAFSILQRSIEHTEILIHPAARIKAPVFIGNNVMVGKQCEIDAECVLGKNVCLYPFNIYNRETQGQNMYIYVGEKTVFCKNTKVLGSIRIGRECVINKAILVGNSIEDKSYVEKNSITKVDNKMRLENEEKVMEGAL